MWTPLLFLLQVLQILGTWVPFLTTLFKISMSSTPSINTSFSFPHLLFFKALINILQAIHILLFFYCLLFFYKNLSLIRAGIFVCSVHCFISSTFNNVWHIVGVQEIHLLTDFSIPKIFLEQPLCSRHC